MDLEAGWEPTELATPFAPKDAEDFGALADIVFLALKPGRMFSKGLSQASFVHALLHSTGISDRLLRNHFGGLE